MIRERVEPLPGLGCHAEGQRGEVGLIGRRAVKARMRPSRDCTTRLENAHRTALREVLYRYHPWFGRHVCVHGTIDKADGVVFRCALDRSQADRWLEVPAWMFDRTACPDELRLTPEPLVSAASLAALSALLDLALKDRAASSNAPLSGKSSHDQNRGEVHARIPRRSAAAAAADGFVQEQSARRRHRRACMAGSAGRSASDTDQPDDAVDPRPCCEDSGAARQGGRS